MESSNDQFDSLRKLLTCKNVEQPAPDYFEDLPMLVRERIESLPPPPPPNAIERVMAIFEFRPVLAAAYGVVICGGVFVGLRFSETLRKYPLPKPEAREWVEPLPLALQSSHAWTGDESQARVMTEAAATKATFHESGMAGMASGPLFVTHGSNSEFQRASFQR
jgi:hypothetical protein